METPSNKEDQITLIKQLQRLIIEYQKNPTPETFTKMMNLTDYLCKGDNSTTYNND